MASYTVLHNSPQRNIMHKISQNSAALGEIDHGKLQTQLQSDRFARQLKLGLGLGCLLILYFAALPLFA